MAYKQVMVSQRVCDICGEFIDNGSELFAEAWYGHVTYPLDLPEFDLCKDCFQQSYLPVINNTLASITLAELKKKKGN